MAAELRALARERLARGELPRERARVVIAAVPQPGQRCALCGEVIASHVEIRATSAGAGILHFHGRCHWAWDVEVEAGRP